MKKKNYILIGLIILTATILRFYRLPEKTTFLGDQGRDLLETRESLIANKLPLVGPLSNEGIHAGPTYYYLITPSLLISKFHPLGPIYFTTFLGVISVFLIYFLGTKIFGKTPSVLAAALYATSPVVIQRTQGLWNPIPVPFFSLLIIYSFYQIQAKKKLVWFIPLGFFSSIAIQLYIPAFFLIIPILAWWFIKIKFKHFKWTLAGFLTFIITLSPFLIFQLKNQFTDFRNLILNFLEKTSFETKNYLTTFLTLLNQQFQALFPIKSTPFILFLGIIILFLPFFQKKKSKNGLFWHKFLLFWFLSGILTLTLYPTVTPQHYANFIWILPFLLLASSLKNIKKNKLLLAISLIFVTINLKTFINTSTITNDLARTETISQLISQKTNQQPFSILLLSPRSPSDAHFRYFLKLKDTPVKSLKNQNISQLFLICTKSTCPTKEKVQKMSIIETECLPSCPPYPKQKSVELKNWQFISQTPVAESQIYLFQRKIPAKPLVPGNQK